MGCLGAFTSFHSLTGKRIWELCTVSRVVVVQVLLCEDQVIAIVKRQRNRPMNHDDNNNNKHNESNPTYIVVIIIIIVCVCVCVCEQAYGNSLYGNSAFLMGFRENLFDFPPHEAMYSELTQSKHEAWWYGSESTETGSRGLRTFHM